MINFVRNIRPRTRVFKKQRRINPVGLKRQYAPVPGAPETYSTPWFVKARNRRRAATRSATLARKRNRLVAQRAKRKNAQRRRNRQGGAS